jgi:hypothetical protein
MARRERQRTQQVYGELVPVVYQRCKDPAVSGCIGTKGSAGFFDGAFKDNSTAIVEGVS